MTVCLPLHWNEANIGTSRAPLMHPQTLAQRSREPARLGVLAKSTVARFPIGNFPPLTSAAYRKFLVRDRHVDTFR